MKLFSSHSSWSKSSLEDIAIHIIGGDWGKDPEFSEEGYESVSCIRGSEFKNWKKNFGNTAVIRKVKASSLTSRELLKNDILVEISGGGPDQPVGRTVLIDDRVLNNQTLPLVCTNFLRLVRLSSEVSASFINRYLEFFYSSGEVTKYQGGSNNLRNLKFKDYSKIELPLPSLAEQKIIAEKLDTLLAQVDTTKARLEQIPQILKRFRQAVLSMAISGKLTDEWRGNKSILFSEWINSSIGELAQVATGKTPKRTEITYWENGSIPWLTSSSTGRAYVDSAEQFITLAALKECTLKIFPPGTLLLAMYGEGKTRGQVTELNISATCNQACAAIICNKEKIDLQFLKMRLMENYEETRKAAAGGNQPNLNLNKVREIPVLVPPLTEQHEIVRRVEQLFAYADTIEKQVNSALDRVNNLTQSILAKAFRGELTAQWRAKNPDLISGENSAAALLKKIKAERAASGGKKASRKKI